MDLLSSLQPSITKINDFVWGPPMLALLLGTGLWLQIRLKGMPLRCILYGFRVIWFSRVKNKDCRGDISAFAALMTSLASAVGTGNIIGISTAIAIGGPGALFWLIFSAMLSMANKYGEVLLSVYYRQTDKDGMQLGGPMYAIQQGMKKHWHFLAYAFAAFGVITSFGTGGLVQANGISHVMRATFHVPLLVSGLVNTCLAGVIIIGGIKRIGEFSEKIVPFMCFSYLFCGLWVIIKRADQLPNAFHLIVQGAFHPMAAVGGFVGSTVLMAMHYGVARGIFCNEAGLGTAAIAQSAGKSDHCVTSGIIGMMGTFIDTFMVCSITGLVIIVTGSWYSGLAGEELASVATQSVVPYGQYIIAIELLFFAFTTTLAWAYYGERCLHFLWGPIIIWPYRCVYVLVIFIGAIAHLDTVWIIADTMNALMAIPNLISLLVMSPLIVQQTSEYFKQEGAIRS